MAAIVMLDAVAVDGASDPVETGGFYRPQVQIYSNSTSTATIDIQARASSSAPWVTMATVTNPTGGTEGGVYYALPPVHQIRVKVSGYSAGNITALLELATFAYFRQVY